MIIKGEPEELHGQPLISAQDPRTGEKEKYMGRVIVEFWYEEGQQGQDPAFAWSVDEPEERDEQWYARFLAGLDGALRHMKDTYRFRQTGIPDAGEE